jgi:hypothetical protein
MNTKIEDKKSINISKENYFDNIGASDSDTIEREWVVATKRILKKYADDPYELSTQIGLLKQKYLGIRATRLMKSDNTQEVI